MYIIYLLLLLIACFLKSLAGAVNHYAIFVINVLPGIPMLNGAVAHAASTE